MLNIVSSSPHPHFPPPYLPCLPLD